MIDKLSRHAVTPPPNCSFPSFTVLRINIRCAEDQSAATADETAIAFDDTGSSIGLPIAKAPGDSLPPRTYRNSWHQLCSKRVEIIKSQTCDHFDIIGNIPIVLSESKNVFAFSCLSQDCQIDFIALSTTPDKDMMISKGAYIARLSIGLSKLSCFVRSRIATVHARI